ncbi:MAG: ROK family protein [Hyphomicrobiaceae bacterium]|nr:ROK family protein [Hyphomicrobiaceae bacterium]
MTEPVAESDRLRVGIDLGGTKIEGVALGPDGSERGRLRIAAPRGDYAATIEAVAGLVAALEQSSPGSGSIGIGAPGSTSPRTGLMQNANSVWLNSRPLRADLEARLNRPVRLANDANCFAISEAADGAGAGCRNVFGVILGTGCGGGIVFDRRIVDGPRGIGGEWGHNPLPWMTADEHPGPMCWCGRPGCMETWVSGTGLAADHARVTGEVIGGEEIVRRAEAGDLAAGRTLDRHADRLARGLAQVVNLIDPDVIVLGGGLSKLSHLYDAVPRLMERWVFADTPRVTIRPPRWGDASGVRGAAWLWD